MWARGRVRPCELLKPLLLELVPNLQGDGFGKNQHLVDIAAAEIPPMKSLWPVWYDELPKITKRGG